MLILAVLLASTMITSVQGASIDITVVRDSITLALHLQLQENFTSLPQVRIVIDSTNSSLVVPSMQQGIQKLVPTAHVDRFLLQITTKTTIQGMWVLDENYTISVGGANNNLVGVARSNLSFLSMDVSNPIALAGFEINGVGRAYLVQAVTGVQAAHTVYYDSGHIFLNSVVPGNDTLAFRLLDFAWIPPVSKWTQVSRLPVEPTEWTYTPIVAPYNVTAGQTTPENTLFPIYTAFFIPTVKLDAPARAWANGTTISFDLPTAFDLAMPFIIGTLVVVAVISALMDRRLTGPRSFKRRRK